ncbi:MAG: polysaccharide deacetylase family protein [Bacteroidales bacterium]|nr:polysaccharide deacetylase family protein [Bacteroidales bacterium]
MKRVLTTLLLTLLAGALFAREAKVAVVMSKTSYGIAESETGSAGKAWTAVANLAGLPYETLFVEDLKEEALDTYSLLVLSQCLYLTDAEYALVDKAVRHFVEAGKGVVVDGPAGLYDHEEEFRKDRTLDTYLGMRYLYDVPMDGFRLRVADNDHFITGPYQADQALSNLLTASLPVLSVSAPARTLVSVTNDIHTYPFASILKKGEGKVAILDGLSAKTCIGTSFKNYDPKGFFPSEVYPLLMRTLQWCQWGDVPTPFPSLLLSDGDMTAIIRLDGDGSIYAPSMVQCMDYLIDLAEETGVQSVFSFVSSWATRAGWHFFVDRARQMQEQGSVIATHTMNHRLEGLRTEEEFTTQLDGSRQEIRENLSARGFDPGEIRYLINPGNTLAMHQYHQVAKRYDLFMTHGLDQNLEVTYGNMTWFTDGIQLPVIGDSPSPDYQWLYDPTWSHTTAEIANYQNMVLEHYASQIGNGVILDLMWHDYGMSNILYAGPRFISRLPEGTRVFNEDNWELYETTRNFWATHNIYCPEPEELAAKMKFLSNAAYQWRWENGVLVMDIRFDAETFGKYAKYVGGMAVAVNNTAIPIRRVEIDGKPHAAFSDSKVILPCPTDARMTVKVFFDGATVPRLEYTSKILKAIAATPEGLEAEVTDRSVARLRFRLTEPSVVVGASSYTVTHDGSTVACRMEGSGKVTVAANPTPIRILSSTLPITKFQPAGKGAKVTVKANGKRHNRLVYVDASGNRMVKEIRALQNEKTIAL